MSEWQADERDVVKVLTVLAAESRVYRLHLEQARPIIERLAEDMEDVAVGMLWTSITAALAEPAHLGTPRSKLLPPSAFCVTISLLPGAVLCDVRGSAASQPGDGGLAAVLPPLTDTPAAPRRGGVREQGLRGRRLLAAAGG